MENLNNKKNRNNEIISQSTDEMESLNDNGELDIETLENIAGGLHPECPCKDCNKIVQNNDKL